MKKSLMFISLLAIPCLIFSMIGPNEISDSIDLSGQWKFQIDSLDVGIDEKWYATQLEDEIELPGSMPLRGKGIPVGYTTEFTGNMWKEYPEGQHWYEDKNYQPYLDHMKFRFPFWLISDYHYVGAAWYQKEVVLPDDWVDKDIELFLERCHWETILYVNGQHIGLNNTLGIPHKYRIGRYLKQGRNTITIRVDNRVKSVKVGDDAHSISDNTQSNWNGIVGNLKLIRKDLISVSGVNIYPDINLKTVDLKIELENNSGSAKRGNLLIYAKGSAISSRKELETLEIPFEIKEDSLALNVEYSMGQNVQLWDEFNPYLYNMHIQLQTQDYNDSWIGTFGMREIEIRRKQIEINGRPTFLRGTLECAIFPKTGFPPTDVASWERIINICKDHGLNHIRFHSWCPPKAAFEAADKLGFYFQVEASAWTAVGDGAPIDQWVYDESNRMVEEYGNHPSFCLMAYGNEPGGKNHRAYLTDFVEYWKKKDDRRIYTTAAGWPVVEENDFNNIHQGTRIQGWNQNLNSVINKEAPRSDYDWEETIADHNAPMISHEVGQWCVYPNFNEIPKYDGVLKATNFEIFQASLKDRGLHYLADDFVQASGKLQALCYKADIEAAYRTKGFGGFQLLDLHDFPGQGTALVGVLDPFWDEKGYIEPEEFRQFSNETVPLARFEKMIFTDDELIEAEIEIAHYGAEVLKAVTPRWRIIDENRKLVKLGRFDIMDIGWGNCQPIGQIKETIKIDKAAKFTLEVEVNGFMNSWDFWVYPSKLPVVDHEVLVVSTLTEEAKSTLRNGGKVLLTAKKGSVREGHGGEVAVGFSSIFWNTAWTNGQKPHTLGILCDPEHAAFQEFPTEYHSNWQWWDAMSHSNAISLDHLKNKPKPIVRIIDDWVTNRNLALIFEANVGSGKLMVTGIDLITKADERPEAKQFMHSLLKYMSSDEFQPETALEIDEIQAVFMESE